MQLELFRRRSMWQTQLPQDSMAQNSSDSSRINQELFRDAFILACLHLCTNNWARLTVLKKNPITSDLHKFSNRIRAEPVIRWLRRHQDDACAPIATLGRQFLRQTPVRWPR